MKKIKESKLRNIIKEAISDYIDNGEFSPIGYPSVNLKQDTRDVVYDNTEKLKYVCTKLMDALHNNSTYMKHACEFETELNPMFWKGMPEGKKKKQLEIAQQILLKCNDFYNYLKNAQQEL